MKKIVLFAAAALSACLALFANIHIAVACQACNLETSRCVNANYSKCADGTTENGIKWCEEEFARCAHVLNVSDLAGDGMLAIETGRTVTPSATEFADGVINTVACSGVILESRYSAEMATRLETETRIIRI